MPSPPFNAPIQASPATASRSGLLASANVIDGDFAPRPPGTSGPGSPEGEPPGQTRWTLGFSWQPEICSGGGTFDQQCDAETNDKSITEDPGQINYLPFGVWVGDSCSVYGVYGRDWEGRVARALTRVEGFQIEQEFWTGAQALARGDNNMFLAKGGTSSTLLTSGAVSTRVALEFLEEYLRSCASGGRGMIHATRQVVASWFADGMLERIGDLVIVQSSGNIVVPGGGYDGSGPGAGVDDDPVAAASGAIWAYATDLVTVRRSSIQYVPSPNANLDDYFREALSRSANTVAVRAERLAAVHFDHCCHARVQINLNEIVPEQ